MTRKISLLLIFILSGLASYAEVLSPAEALAAARAAIPDGPKKAPSSAKYVLSHTELDSAGLQPCYYAFSNTSGGGTIIASADSRFVPLLGYTDHGVFDAENLPDGLEYFLGEYKREMAHFKDYQPAENPEKAPRRISYGAVEPILKCEWDQGQPYNQATPAETPTGCGATAMAQVMYAHQWPRDRFEWGYILPKYEEGKYNGLQASAVSKLMAECGSAMNMIYGFVESSSYAYDVPAAFCSMGYSKTDIVVLHRDYWDPVLFDQLINIELQAGRPLFYSGQGARGGHAFVLDGSDGNGLYHFNWGWSGIGNGYYVLSSLRPTGTGIGDNSGEYTFSQAAIAGIRPGNGEGIEQSPVLIGCGDLEFGLGGITSSGESIHGFWNSSIDTHCFALGMRFESASGKLYNPADESLTPLKVGQFINAFYNMPDLDRVPEGNYTARPVFKTEYTDWQPCPMPVYSKRALGVKVDDHGALRFENHPANPVLYTSPEWEQMIEPSDPFTAKLNVTNVFFGRQRLKITLRVAELPENNTRHFYFDLNRDESRDLQLSMPVDVPEGIYTMEMIENDGEPLFSLRFMVKHNPLMDITEENFPDPVFRDYISRYLDTDHDGQLSLIENENITFLNLMSGLKSLQGLDNFLFIKSLVIDDSPELQAIDLSGNPHLEMLTVLNTGISHIDFSHTPDIATLQLDYNKIEELDVSVLPSLQTLICSHNQLKTLDLSANHKLATLKCDNNAIESLVLPADNVLSVVNATANRLESIDLPASGTLSTIYLNENALSTLNLSGCPSLAILNVSKNALSSLDLSANSDLQRLFATDNRLSHINLGANHQLSYAFLTGNVHLLDFRDTVDFNSIPGLDPLRVRALTAYAYDEEKSSRDYVSYPAMTGGIVAVPDGANMLAYTYDTGNPAATAEFAILRSAGNSGVAGLELDKLEISVNGLSLKVVSPVATVLPLATPDGRMMLLPVDAGTSEHALPAPGIYILGGRKLLAE